MTVTIVMACHDKKIIPYKVFGSESVITRKVQEVVDRFRPDEIDESKIKGYSVVAVQYKDGEFNVYSAISVDQDFLNALASISSPRSNYDDEIVDDNMIDLLKQFHQ